MLSQFVLVRLLAVAAVLSAVPSFGAVRKELAWSQSDGLRDEIYASSFRNGAWSDPVKLTDDNANKLHPALAVGPDGSRWVFWSAVAPDSISIGYTMAAKDGAWSQPSVMDTKGSSAITPSALIDSSGTLWLVWAGNDGGQDEIYCRRWVGSAWQEPELVNKANEVPDIKPIISQNAQGQIEVRWQGFRSGKYVPLVAVYAKDHWSAEQQTEAVDNAAQVQKERQELPEFVPAASQYSLKTF
ncbi:TolB family protein [Candidatus Electronema sp. JM]|uniref:TolB family protein n=1 Tax=Candidatus Electronema sp. JM TaxID=3401571 RepID=UPI003AA83A26